MNRVLLVLLANVALLTGCASDEPKELEQDSNNKLIPQNFGPDQYPTHAHWQS